MLGNSQSGSHLPGYTSNALRLFLEGLEQVRESQVLDVGSICGDNITFFARRIKRLYICDMFFHLSRDSRGILPPNQIWKHLDYPPHSFDGILLWNLIDYLNDSQVGRIAALCHDMLKPEGMVLASLAGKSMSGTVPCYFAIKDRFRLEINPKPEIGLSLHIRSNREVLELLSLFTPEKSYLYQNGIREYLLRNN
ncbi:MAG: class I SAM-dependent methyltransferase [Deltaproteobacteria bacterium]|uniref:Class I SAM-dependent methyltransferase n=1 Tax=Candidatus Desulfacyla euxinica TaxID=2841693 RepID=A0A8J6T5J1_9DELT|nr:class I SAM-dependent methyltransferase [Candidatus Desulfacyla euxinica]